MMLGDGFDPYISVGSASPYDIGRIIVACIEEERQEAADVAAREASRREEERQRAGVASYSRYMIDRTPR